MTLSALPVDGSTVKLKGLPFKASVDDILRFFLGFSLQAESVYLKRHPDGRPNGEVGALSLREHPLLCRHRAGAQADRG